jgi:MazG family protein
LKEIERAENGDDHQKGLLDGIPAILPALSQAQSIQERAARVGFDWPEIQPVIEKVMEELQEVSQAQSALEREHELGDLLFAVVNLVRWYKVDAESALRYTNTKFRKRFAYLESQARQAGRELQKMTLEEMDALWEDAKAFDD